MAKSTTQKMNYLNSLCIEISKYADKYAEKY